MQKMSAERFPLGLRDDNDEIFAEERVARRAAVRRILKDRGLGEVMPLPQESQRSNNLMLRKNCIFEKLKRISESNISEALDTGSRVQSSKKLHHHRERHAEKKNVKIKEEVEKLSGSDSDSLFVSKRAFSGLSLLSSNGSNATTEDTEDKEDVLILEEEEVFRSIFVPDCNISLSYSQEKGLSIDERAVPTTLTSEEPRAKNCSGSRDTSKQTGSNSTMFASAESLLSPDDSALQLELLSIPSEEEKEEYVNGYIKYRSFLMAMDKEEGCQQSNVGNRFKTLDAQIASITRFEQHTEETQAHAMLKGYADEDEVSTSCDYALSGSKATRRAEEEKMEHIVDYALSGSKATSHAEEEEMEHIVDFCSQTNGSVVMGYTNKQRDSTATSNAAKHKSVYTKHIGSTHTDGWEAFKNPTTTASKKNPIRVEGSVSGSVAGAIRGIAFRKHSRNAIPEAAYKGGLIRSALDDCPSALSETIKNPVLPNFGDDETISEVGGDNFVKEAMDDSFGSDKSTKCSSESEGSKSCESLTQLWSDFLVQNNVGNDVGKEEDTMEACGGDDFVMQAMAECFANDDATEMEDKARKDSEELEYTVKESHTPGVKASISLPTLVRRSDHQLKISASFNATDLFTRKKEEHPTHPLVIVDCISVPELIPSHSTLTDHPAVTLNEELSSLSISDQQSESKSSDSTDSTLTLSSSTATLLCEKDDTPQAVAPRAADNPPISSADMIEFSLSDITRMLTQDMGFSMLGSLLPTNQVSPSTIEQQKIAKSQDSDSHLNRFSLETDHLTWEYGIVPSIVITPPSPPLEGRSFSDGGPSGDSRSEKFLSVDKEEPLVSKMSMELGVNPTITIIPPSPPPLQDHGTALDWNYDIVHIVSVYKPAVQVNRQRATGSTSEPSLGGNPIPPVQPFASLQNIKMKRWLPLSLSESALRIPRKLQRLALYCSEPTIEHSSIPIKPFTSMKFSSAVTSDGKKCHLYHLVKNFKSLLPLSGKHGVCSSWSEPAMRCLFSPIKPFASTPSINLKPSFLKALTPSTSVTGNTVEGATIEDKCLTSVFVMGNSLSPKLDQYSAFFLTVPEESTDKIEDLEREIMSANLKSGIVPVLLVASRPKACKAGNDTAKQVCDRVPVSSESMPCTLNKQRCSLSMPCIKLNCEVTPIADSLILENLNEEAPDSSEHAVVPQDTAPLLEQSSDLPASNGHATEPHLLHQSLSSDLPANEGEIEPLDNSASLLEKSNDLRPCNEHATEPDNASPHLLELSNRSGTHAMEQDDSVDSSVDSQEVPLLGNTKSRSSEKLTAEDPEYTMKPSLQSSAFSAEENKTGDSASANIMVSTHSVSSGCPSEEQDSAYSVSDDKLDSEDSFVVYQRLVSTSMTRRSAMPNPYIEFENRCIDSIESGRKVTSLTSKALEADSVQSIESLSPTSSVKSEEAASRSLENGSIKQAESLLSTPEAEASKLSTEDESRVKLETSEESDANDLVPSNASVELEDVYTLMANNATSSSASSEADVYALMVSDASSSKNSLENEPECVYSLMAKDSTSAESSSHAGYSDSSVKLKNFFSRKKCVVISSPSLNSTSKPSSPRSAIENSTKSKGVLSRKSSNSSFSRPFTSSPSQTRGAATRSSVSMKSSSASFEQDSLHSKSSQNSTSTRNRKTPDSKKSSSVSTCSTRTMGSANSMKQDTNVSWSSLKRRSVYSHSINADVSRSTVSSRGRQVPSNYSMTPSVSTKRDVQKNSSSQAKSTFLRNSRSPSIVSNNVSAARSRAPAKQNHRSHSGQPNQLTSSQRPPKQACSSPSTGRKSETANPKKGEVSNKVSSSGKHKQSQNGKGAPLSKREARKSSSSKGETAKQRSRSPDETCSSQARTVKRRSRSPDEISSSKARTIKRRSRSPDAASSPAKSSPVYAESVEEQTPQPVIQVTPAEKEPRTNSAPSSLRNSSNVLKIEYSYSSAEYESEDSQQKCVKSNSAPSLPPSQSSGEDTAVPPKPSATLRNTAADLKSGVEARIALLSSAPQSFKDRLSLFAVDSPLQCHPPPPTPVSSDKSIAAQLPSPTLLPSTSDRNHALPEYSDIDPMYQKYLKMLSTATPLMQRILTSSDWPVVAFLLEVPIKQYPHGMPKWFKTIQGEEIPKLPGSEEELKQSRQEERTARECWVQRVNVRVAQPKADDDLAHCEEENSPRNSTDFGSQSMLQPIGTHRTVRPKDGHPKRNKKCKDPHAQNNKYYQGDDDMAVSTPQRKTSEVAQKLLQNTCSYVVPQQENDEVSAQPLGCTATSAQTLPQDSLDNLVLFPYVSQYADSVSRMSGGASIKSHSDETLKGHCCEDFVIPERQTPTSRTIHERRMRPVASECTKYRTDELKSHSDSHVTGGHAKKEDTNTNTTTSSSSSPRQSNTDNRSEQSPASSGVCSPVPGTASPLSHEDMAYITDVTSDGTCTPTTPCTPDFGGDNISEVTMTTENGDHRKVRKKKVRMKKFLSSIHKALF